MKGFTWIDMAILIIYLAAVLFPSFLKERNEGKRIFPR